MRYFFLFYLLNYLLHNPLLALIVLGTVFYLGEARYSGRYFNPTTFFSARSQLSELASKLSVNPHDVAAHNDLGRLLAGQGKFKEALPHMEAAIARMDESAETNYFLGLCLLHCGQSESGIEYIEKALELSPSFLYGEPRRVLARHYFDSGNYREAAEQARLCVKKNTSAVEGWYLLGASEQELGNKKKARQAYASAVEAYNNLPHYLKLAGRSWNRRARKALRSLQG